MWNQMNICDEMKYRCLVMALYNPRLIWVWDSPWEHIFETALPLQVFQTEKKVYFMVSSGPGSLL